MVRSEGITGTPLAPEAERVVDALRETEETRPPELDGDESKFRFGVDGENGLGDLARKNSRVLFLKLRPGVRPLLLLSEGEGEASARGREGGVGELGVGVAVDSRLEDWPAEARDRLDR